MIYLTPEQVEKIHVAVMEQFGGAYGIRSMELLESAVFRMQATFGGEDLYQDIFEKAGAILESLCKNHPFIDGNKRTAFTAAVTFLELNDYETKFDQKETEEIMLGVAMGKIKFNEIANFLKANTTKK